MDNHSNYYERIILKGNGNLHIFDYVLEHEYGDNMLDLKCLNSYSTKYVRKIMHKKDLDQAFLIFPNTRNEAVEMFVKSDKCVTISEARICLIAALNNAIMEHKNVQSMLEPYRTFLMNYLHYLKYLKYLDYDIRKCF